MDQTKNKKDQGVQPLLDKEGPKEAEQLQKAAFQEKNIATNHSYVMLFVLTFAFGSTIQGGWVLSECGQVAMVLDKKLGWNAVGSDYKIVNYITICVITGSAGLALGSLLGGWLLPKYGSRKIVLAANIIGLFCNCIKLIENTTCILIGRFIFGIMAQAAGVSLAKTINDTVPAKNQQQYGAFINAGFNLGLFTSNFIGLLVPLDNGNEGDVQKMIDDKYWRLVFGFPILLEFFTIISLTFFIKHDSIIDLLQHEKPDSELLQTELSKVYKITDQLTYRDLAVMLKGNIKMKEASPVSVVEAFSNPKYRRASITGLMIMMAQQFSGISGVLTFQTQMFLDMSKKGEFNISPIIAVQITNFMNLLFSFAFAILSKYFRQKGALIVSQIGIICCLFSLVIFQEMKQSLMIMMSIAAYISFFQYGIGTICWIHLFETTLDAMVGLGNMFIFFWIFTTQIITPNLLRSLGESGFFLFFGTASIFFLLFTIFFLRDTNYWLEDEDKATGKKIKVLIQLTEEEKKELYWPDEYKEEVKSDGTDGEKAEKASTVTADAEGGSNAAPKSQ